MTDALAAIGAATVTFLVLLAANLAYDGAQRRHWPRPSQSEPMRSTSRQSERAGRSVIAGRRRQPPDLEGSGGA